MNKLKSNARILLILIISAFIVIPIVAVLTSKAIGVHEGMNTYDMTAKNQKMDRIDMEGVTFKNKNGDEATGAAGDYLYCIGGDIICSDDTSALSNDENGATYTDNSGNTHNSYKQSCGSDGHAVCANHVATTSDNSVSLFDSTNTEFPLSGPPDDKFKGFLGPYSYIPMYISDKFVYLYDTESKVYSSEAISACFLYGDCSDETTTDTTADTTADTNDSTDKSIKCLANNGAKPGDPLCCGQDGVLQDTKYNCPSEYPHCIGYKCGETWGKCSTISDK